MHRILVVDDEPPVAEMVSQLLRRHFQSEHDVLCCTSGQEALELVSRLRIDLLVSDVRMPSPDGVELQRRVRERWPRCKVIFLSAHSDFGSIQSLMRCDGVDYVLKAEEDEALLQAVERGLAVLDQETDAESLIARAERHMRDALPLRRQELLRNIVLGRQALQESFEHFEEVDLPFDNDRPVLLVLNRVDQVAAGSTLRERERRDYNIASIVEEYLASQALTAIVSLDASRSVWIVQPKKTSRDNSFCRYVRETIPTIQRSVQAICQVSVSLALTTELVSWENVAEIVRALTTLMLVEGGLDSGVILYFQSCPGAKAVSAEARWQSASPAVPRDQFLDIDVALASPRATDLADALQSVVTILSDARVQWIDKANVFSGLAFTLTSHLRRHGLHDRMVREVDLSPLTDASRLENWEHIATWFQSVFMKLFDMQRSIRLDSDRDVVRRIEEYIENHLDQDVSLTRIGDAVGLNASYLSRLYSDQTGSRISDRIAELRIETARKLLTNSDLQIQQIANAIGLGSSSYFIKVFRAAMGCTPQAYRDLSR